MGICVADFKPFINVEEINLSYNKLSDITNIGLNELPKLKVLDVSFNAIATPLKAVRNGPLPSLKSFYIVLIGNATLQLASFLDQLTSLECLSIRENPTVKNFAEDRKKLIGLMDSMKEVQCRLQVIDYQVSIAERVESWRQVAKKQKGIEKKQINA